MIGLRTAQFIVESVIHGEDIPVSYKSDACSKNEYLCQCILHGSKTEYIHNIYFMKLACVILAAVIFMTGTYVVAS